MLDRPNKTLCLFRNGPDGAEALIDITTVRSCEVRVLQRNSQCHSKRVKSGRMAVGGQSLTSIVQRHKKLQIT